MKLDDLVFDVRLDDKTEQDIKSLTAKLEQLTAKMNTAMNGAGQSAANAITEATKKMEAAATSLNDAAKAAADAAANAGGGGGGGSNSKKEIDYHKELLALLEKIQDARKRAMQAGMPARVGDGTLFDPNEEQLYKQLEKVLQNLSNSATEAAQRIAQAKQTLKEQNAFNVVADLAPSAYERQKQRLDSLITQYKRLSAAEREGEKGKTLLGQITQEYNGIRDVDNILQRVTQSQARLNELRAQTTALGTKGSQERDIAIAEHDLQVAQRRVELQRTINMLSANGKTDNNEQAVAKMELLAKYEQERATAATRLAIARREGKAMATAGSDAQELAIQERKNQLLKQQATIRVELAELLRRGDALKDPTSYEAQMVVEQRKNQLLQQQLLLTTELNELQRMRNALATENSPERQIAIEQQRVELQKQMIAAQERLRQLQAGERDNLIMNTMYAQWLEQGRRLDYQRMAQSDENSQYRINQALQEEVSLVDQLNKLERELQRIRDKRDGRRADPTSIDVQAKQEELKLEQQIAAVQRKIDDYRGAGNRRQLLEAQAELDLLNRLEQARARVLAINNNQDEYKIALQNEDALKYQEAVLKQQYLAENEQLIQDRLNTEELIKSKTRLLQLNAQLQAEQANGQDVAKAQANLEVERQRNSVLAQQEKLRAEINLLTGSDSISKQYQANIVEKERARVSRERLIIEERLAVAKRQQQTAGNGTTTTEMRVQTQLLNEMVALQAKIAFYKTAEGQKLKELRKEYEDIARIERTSSTQQDPTKRSQSRTQLGVLGEMLSMARSYIGLWGAMNFIKSLTRITGEFERQYVALSTLVGNARMARDLFSQLQGMALESPFTFQQLTTYTKQLAAYQLPARDLLDTTKRLADLSAGLGVDMNRLILAYGQVKSATVLRGQELRQFTEAGLPMVQALADKFSQLEGRVVSTQEVFKRISKRAVSFEMVKEVIQDATDAGGAFYDMQKQISDTLYGKVQKLGDAWQIMLNKIGSTGMTSKILGGTLNAITALFKNWELFLSIVLPIAVNRLALAFWKLGGVIINVFRNMSTAGWIGWGLTFLAMIATYFYNISQAANQAREQLMKDSAEMHKQLQRFFDTHKVYMHLSLASDVPQSDLLTYWEDLKEEVEKTPEGQNYIAFLMGQTDDLLERVIAVRDALLAMKDVAEGLKDSAPKWDLPNFDRTDVINIPSWTKWEKQDIFGKDFIMKFESNLNKIAERMLNADPKNREALFNTLVANLAQAYELTTQEEIGKFENIVIDYFRTHNFTSTKGVKATGIDLLGGFTLDNATNAMDTFFKRLREQAAETGVNLRDLANDLNSSNEEVKQNALKKLQEISKAAANQVQSDMPRIYEDIMNFINNHPLNWVITFQQRLGTPHYSELQSYISEMMKSSKEMQEAREKGFTGITPASRLGAAWLNDNEDVSAYDKRSSDEIKRLREAIKKDQAAVNAAAQHGEELAKLNAEIQSSQNLIKNFELVRGWLGLGGVTDDKKKGSRQNHEDPWLEELKRRIDEYKKARQLVDKLSKEIGETAAIDFVAGLDGWSEELNKEFLTHKGLSALAKWAREQLAQAGLNTKERRNYDKSLLDTQQSQMVEDRAQEMREQNAQLLKLLNVTKEQYDLWEQLRETTHGSGLAELLAFGNIGKFNRLPTSTYQALVNTFNKAIADPKNSEIASRMDAAGFANYADIAKEWAAGELNDESLERLLGKELVQAFKLAYNEGEDERKKLLTDIANITKQYQTLTDEIAALDFEYEQAQKKATKFADSFDRALTEQEQAELDALNRRVEAIGNQVEWKKFQKTNLGYATLMTAPLAMGTWSQIDETIRQTTEHLNQVFLDGTISADEYADAIKRLYDAKTKIADRRAELDFENSTFAKIFGTGKTQKERAEADYDEKFQAMQKASIALQQAVASGDQDAIEEAQTNLATAREELDKSWIRLVKINSSTLSKMSKYVNVLGDNLRGLRDGVQAISDLFESFGMDTSADSAIGTTLTVLDSMLAVTDGLSKTLQSASTGNIGGIVGGIFQTLATPFTIWNTWADAKHERRIEKSKQRVEQLKEAYDYLSQTIKRKLGGGFTRAQVAATALMRTMKDLSDPKNLKGQSAYGQQLQSLIKQREELMYQEKEEQAKKKKDKDALREYRQEIAELTDQIMYFWEDLAKELYDIDLKGWAQQIGDALVDAFARGDSAALAFDDTVANIIKSMIKRMASLYFIEPLLENLRTMLFGEKGFLTDNSEEGARLSKNEASQLFQWLNTDLRGGMKEANDFISTLFDLAKEAGIDLSDDARSGGVGKGISEITEDTADLLASYVNAIRLDVSVLRGIAEGQQQMMPIAQSQLTQLQAIATSTQRNADAAEEILSALNAVTAVGASGKKIRV